MRHAGHRDMAPVTSKALGKAKKVKKVKKAAPRSRREQERAMQALSERGGPSPSHHSEYDAEGSEWQQTEGEGEELGTSMPYNLPPSPSRHATPGLSAHDRSRLTARVNYASGRAAGGRTERSMTPQFDQVAMADAAIGTSMAVDPDHPAGPSERPVYKVMTVGGSKGRATAGGGGGVARQHLPTHPAPSQPVIPAPLLPPNGYPNADDGDQDTSSPGRGAGAGATTPASEVAGSTGSHTPGHTPGGTQMSYLSQRFQAPSPQMFLHDPHHDHEPPMFPDGDVPGAPGHQPMAVAVNRMAGPAHAEPLPHYIMPAMPEPVVEIYGGGGLEGEGLPRRDKDAAAGLGGALGGAVGLGGFMTGGSLLEKGDGAAMRMSGTGTLASEGAPMGEKPEAVAEEGEGKEGGEAGEGKEGDAAAAEPTADADADADKPAEAEGDGAADGAAPDADAAAATDDAEKAADGEAKGEAKGDDAANTPPPMSQEELDALVTFLVLDSMGREPGERGGRGEGGELGV